MNKNDAAFVRATRRGASQDRPGRPKGAKDLKRRKNKRYLWSQGDIAIKFTERFRVDHDGRGILLGGDCWLWTGASSRGFGYMVIGSRQDNGGKSPRIQAHRLSYQLHKGVIPPKFLVGQTCKNKLCVNPYHLYLWRR